MYRIRTDTENDIKHPEGKTVQPLEDREVGADFPAGRQLWRIVGISV